MESAQDWHSAKALLEWHIELGAIDAITDTPIDRYALEPRTQPAAAQTNAVIQTPAQKQAKRTPTRTAPTPVPETDHIAVAQHAAQAARDLDELKVAIKAFEGCELRRGARNTIIGVGNPAARVMIISDAPNRNDDIEGQPITGAPKVLLDKMFDAIGMSFDSPLSKDALYMVNILPWTTPQNRDPSPHELAMMLPFLHRHVELVAPELIILLGNAPCHAVLKRNSALRLRGNWGDAWGKPVMAMTHPSYLLKNPIAKREAWSDLLQIKAKLEELA